MYDDVIYYKDNYLGKAIPDADISRLSLRARAHLAILTNGADLTTDSAKMATCAVAEALYKIEQGGEIASHSVGSQSISYARETKSDSELIAEAARLYLPDLVRTVRWT